MTLPVEPPIEPMLSAPPGGDPRPATAGATSRSGTAFAASCSARATACSSGAGSAADGALLPRAAAGAQGARSRSGRWWTGRSSSPARSGLDFDSLQLRIHPAASRVHKLSKEIPASFVAFDLLALGDEDLRGAPFDERRARLEQALKQRLADLPHPADPRPSRRRSDWFVEFEGAGMDGVIAKPARAALRARRAVMVKVKHRPHRRLRGGRLPRAQEEGGIGALLLGLYDEQGVLHHVGHTSSLHRESRRRSWWSC